ncbi:L-aspartate oxidase [Edaphobacter albus]|uniref:L-aspartate oxidase n=1 Tax=Edaphobacter sp. 4G125 TaxID=2763071 RepID=UPI0016496729|nr:L-aspartate oxidase [Edaphobacter sp. 4G125]QNI38029.1 L-aspartate oxidase [Edaphobacter sp. 4G125]
MPSVASSVGSNPSDPRGHHVDFLVIGAGIAGLSAAIRLAGVGSVLVVTKEELAESNTSYAQGGIAVAMGGDEDVALHLDDTLAAGDGLVEKESARLLVEQGPVRVQELLEWGTSFDRENGQLMLTREGAHSRSRILHANGDATGREIAVSLLRHVRAIPNVRLLEWTTGIDLIVEQHNRVAGAILLDGEGGILKIYARATLLASGGAGQVYSDTTNPAVATGDGIAMAWRAGAAVVDMEFYQFHPTAFSAPGAPRFLLSEALRGEGAILVNASGERFMLKEHPLAELAPRDVVARAITREGMDGPVHLDMRHVAKDLHERFPGISAFLAKYHLDLNRDLVPVRPAAHYLMGGILTDVHGRTTLPGLYAAGEAACTGVHGANRLASNSLLEGLVFGALAAEAMMADRISNLFRPESFPSISVPAERTPDEQVERWIEDLRNNMWKFAGLLRDAQGLQLMQHKLQALAGTIPQGLSRRAIEARNLYTVASLIVTAALARCESRGAHFRMDYPQHNAEALHSVLYRNDISFCRSLLEAFVTQQ